MLKLDVEIIPSKTNLKEKIAIKPAWYKAKQMDRDNFTMDLQDRLRSLVPTLSLECYDSQCLDKTHSNDRVMCLTSSYLLIIESSHVHSSGWGRVKLDPY